MCQGSNDFSGFLHHDVVVGKISDQQYNGKPKCKFDYLTLKYCLTFFFCSVIRLYVYFMIYNHGQERYIHSRYIRKL